MCSYHQSYGEGSAYSGVFIQDKISFGVNFNKSVLIPFGCHSKYDLIHYIEKQICLFLKMQMVCLDYHLKNNDFQA